MSEESAIARTAAPLSAAALAAELHRCGVREGQTVLVHLAMSKLGFVIGGAEAVLLALLAAVGPHGTLMMVAHSNDNTDPADWRHPPVPEAWWQSIRDHTPAYDPLRTPSRGLGVVPELFRTWPRVLRSSHPAFSHAACGPQAAYLVAEHDLTEDCGDRSPVGKLYALDGHVLLLGVGHGNNTSLHLAETRAAFPGKRCIPGGSAMLVDGVRQWVPYQSLELDDGDFPAIGAAFEAAHGLAVQHINAAEVRFFRQRPLVDFAVGWMEEHRGRH
jgi:aminoglycoside 3-N-acetyltransferase